MPPGFIGSGAMNVEMPNAEPSYAGSIASSKTSGDFPALAAVTG